MNNQHTGRTDIESHWAMDAMLRYEQMAADKMAVPVTERPWFRGRAASGKAEQYPTEKGSMRPRLVLVPVVSPRDPTVEGAASPKEAVVHFELEDQREGVRVVRLNDVEAVF